MSIRIGDDSMAAEADGRVIATASFRPAAAAGGHGAWTVTTRPGRPLTRSQAITALVLAELRAAGRPPGDPRIAALEAELQ